MQTIEAYARSQGLDNVTDWSPVLHDLIANFSPEPSQFPIDVKAPAPFVKAGLTILFEPKLYYFSQTIVLPKGVHLLGSGGYVFATGTTFLFPFNQAGIVCTCQETPENGNSEGRFSIIEKIYLYAIDEFTKAEDELDQESKKKLKPESAHGITFYGDTCIRDCYINNFGGNGIHILSQGGLGAYKKNADCWKAENVFIEGCLNGIYTIGPDSQVGYALGLNCVANRAWGIYEASELGNTYIACHSSYNGIGGAYCRSETPFKIIHQFDTVADVPQGLWDSHFERFNENIADRPSQQARRNYVLSELIPKATANEGLPISQRESTGKLNFGVYVSTLRALFPVVTAPLDNELLECTYLCYDSENGFTLQVVGELFYQDGKFASDLQPNDNLNGSVFINCYAEGNNERRDPHGTQNVLINGTGMIWGGNFLNDYALSKSPFHNFTTVGPHVVAAGCLRSNTGMEGMTLNAVTLPDGQLSHMVGRIGAANAAFSVCVQNDGVEKATYQLLYQDYYAQAGDQQTHPAYSPYKGQWEWVSSARTALRLSTNESDIGPGQIWMENGFYIGSTVDTASLENKNKRVRVLTTSEHDLAATIATYGSCPSGGPNPPDIDNRHVWQEGDRLLNKNPTPGSFAGWICCRSLEDPDVLKWYGYGRIDTAVVVNPCRVEVP
jgi:hypothetical protein